MLQNHNYSVMSSLTMTMVITLGIVVVCLLMTTMVRSASSSSGTPLVKKLSSKLQAKNPLKGFMNYRSSQVSTYFPTTLEYSYFSMKELSSASGVYDFSSIETFKQEANSRGNHIVFRIYLDYPDTGASGVPDYLTEGSNPVTFTSYTDYGGGQSPDYTNQRLLTELKGMISALGKKFDGDVGIAAIKIGLLGFWGEWHCYRMSLIDTLFIAVLVLVIVVVC